MNSLLKAFLKEVFDLVAVGKDIVGKQYTSLFGALVQAGEDVPAIVANYADLKPELQALLANPSADADLLAYVAGLVAGDSAKAQAIISASCSLILNAAESGYALFEALKLPSAPAAAEPAAAPAAPAEPAVG